jgi:hypothetical protein
MTTRQILEALTEAAEQVTSTADLGGECYEPFLAQLEEVIQIAKNHLQGPVTPADEYEASLGAYEQDMINSRSKALRDADAAIRKLTHGLLDNTEPGVALGLSMALDALSTVSYFD